MDNLAIFGLQFFLSVIVYAVIAKWFVTPWLTGKPIHQALIPLVFPSAFRHIGMMFLVAGVVPNLCRRVLPTALPTGTLPAAWWHCCLW